MDSVFQTEQWLPYPVEAVFAFFANPENLPALMPPWQKARIEDATIVAPDPGSRNLPMAGIGSRITLSFVPFPLAPFRVRWQARITEFALNSQFADEQVAGPFAYWRHTHRIRSVDRGGIDITVIADHVEYTPPMGMLGRIADRLFLRKQLERTFAYRQARIAELLPLQLKPVVPITQLRDTQPTPSGKLSA